MRFGILGPVEARVGEELLALGRGRDRALLAMLLLNTNRAVPAELLIDGLWEHPPRTARAALHGYVARLRHLIVCDPGAHELPQLVTDRFGYRLSIELEQLDLSQFEQLVKTAKAAERAGDLDRA